MPLEARGNIDDKPYWLRTATKLYFGSFREAYFDGRQNTYATTVMDFSVINKKNSATAQTGGKSQNIESFSTFLAWALPS